MSLNYLVGLEMTLIKSQEAISSRISAEIRLADALMKASWIKQ